MAIIGEIEIGGVFLYNQALFVVLPFDWESGMCYNLCIATRNNDDYTIGRKYEFEYGTEVIIMSNKIFEMLNLFYANKHLYEKIKKRVDKQNNK